MSNFEITTPTHPPLTGSMNAQVYEGNELSNGIIRTDVDWSVRVHWELKGALVPCICGFWCLHVYLESIGPGPELKLPHPHEIHIPLDPCGDGKYWYDFKVPAGTVSADHCSTPYKVVVALTYKTPAPCKDPGPMAGFCELPILQFYESKK